jgi:uncharacterized damage-inducible protein DinB
MADEVKGEAAAARAAVAAARSVSAPSEADRNDAEMELNLVAVKDADEAHREDAYARHFRLVLSAVLREREDLRFLFADDELEIARRYLDDLTDVEQRVYARLFQRRGPWLKTASLLRYFRSWDERQHHEEDDADEQPTAATANPDGDDGGSEKKWLPTNAEVQKALRLLVELGFLEPLPAAQSSSDAWRNALHAIEQCATAGEMAALHRKLMGSSGKSRKGLSSGASSASSPSEALSGKAGLLDNIKRVVGSQRRIDGSRIPVGTMMQQIWIDGYPLADKSRNDHVVVRVASRSRDVLLRMHRLYYFQATPPFASSLSISSSPDIKQLLGVALSKLRSEPVQWPGLLVFFKKIEYPTYELVNRRRIFESSELYVCYEVARQLHHLLGFVEQFMEVTVPESPEPDLELKWILGESTPLLMAFQRLAAATATAPNDDSDEEFEMLEVETLSSATTGMTSWQLCSWEEFYQVLEERILTLDDLVLLAKSCLKAFMTWTEHMNQFAAFKASSNTEDATAPPAFFAKCNAGHHLARAIHTAVTLYEKQRKYQVAIMLLNELLATPFLKRKRGSWWERLALNLEHLKCNEQALHTCVNALNDPLVLDTDRITIERRHARLQGRLDQPTASAQDDDEALGDSTVSDSKTGHKPDADYNYRASYMVGRPLNRAIGEKSRFIGFDDEPCGVEQLVLQYYRVKHTAESSSDAQLPGSGGKRGGWYGVHCEGMVLGNLFGVFMWDMLYASVPDVFQTPFQIAPLDFGYANAFYSARKALIDERLTAIEHVWSIRELLQFFSDTWNREFGKLSRFVRWPRREGDLSLRFLLLVVVAMGRESLVALLRYMATSEEHHRAQNGLPDLLLLKVEPTSTERSDDDQDDTKTLGEGACLDVYAYCGMEYRTNMNRDDSISAAEQSNAATPSEASKEWEDVLKFVDATKWRLGLKLVEVKGPRDRLSDKQLLWLRILTEQIRVDASVMHVVEEQTQADKQKEKRKKSKQPAKKATTSGSGKKRRKG